MEDKKKLEEKIVELESQVRELESDLIHDSLTGLKTRAFFEEEAEVYLNAIVFNQSGKRKEWFGFKNLSLIFFDIDHFKKVNDTYGHSVGDLVLRAVAQEIMKQVRIGDTVCRWGGEEMITTLLGANEQDAYEKAEEIREKISLLKFSEIPDLSITLSSGVASTDKDVGLEELVKRADEALYRAKETGRNKVVKYTDLSSK